MIHVEKISDPAGETQTLDPRPRPATCTVAVAVNPFGRRERSLGFLCRQLVMSAVRGGVYLTSPELYWYLSQPPHTSGLDHTLPPQMTSLLGTS